MWIFFSLNVMSENETVMVFYRLGSHTLPGPRARLARPPLVQTQGSKPRDISSIKNVFSIMYDSTFGINL